MSCVRPCRKHKTGHSVATVLRNESSSFFHLLSFSIVSFCSSWILSVLIIKRVRCLPLAGGLLQPGWKEDKTTHPKRCRLTSSQPQNVAVSSGCEVNAEDGFLSTFFDGGKYTTLVHPRTSGNLEQITTRAMYRLDAPSHPYCMIYERRNGM